MRVELEYQNQIFNAEAQSVNGHLWIHFQGRIWKIENDKKLFGKTAATKASNGEILAPMPGKITKILKFVGDQIRIGEAVLVMEAMKMEYTMKADSDGVLEFVKCQAGEQVGLGKLLAKVKKAEPSGSDSMRSEPKPPDSKRPEKGQKP